MTLQQSQQAMLWAWVRAETLEQKRKRVRLRGFGDQLEWKREKGFENNMYISHVGDKYLGVR